MNPSARTIRIQNCSRTDLSIQLAHLRSPASPSLRRGVLTLPIKIPAGQSYDVCKTLGLTFDEADRLLSRSPDMKRFLARTPPLLYLVRSPDPEETPAPVPAPIVATETEERRVLELLGQAEVSPEEWKVVTSPVSVSDLLEPAAPPEPEPAAPEEPAFEPEVGLLPIVPEDDEAGQLDEPEIAPVPLTEPSMEWSEDQLRAHALARNIDISRARSKTAILRAVRRSG